MLKDAGKQVKNQHGEDFQAHGLEALANYIYILYVLPYVLINK